MPDKFSLNYIAEDGNKHRPVMIHRTILGSIERFLGILIEHYAGKFPLWLAPVQVKILTVADRFNLYAKKIKEELERDNLRVELDTRTESVGRKVWEAQLQKIPIIINVGEKEEKNKTVAVRTLNNKLHFNVKVKDLVNKIIYNVEKKEESFKL
jgi:threonyl-tRNA synthetase